MDAFYAILHIAKHPTMCSCWEIIYLLWCLLTLESISLLRLAGNVLLKSCHDRPFFSPAKHINFIRSLTSGYIGMTQVFCHEMTVTANDCSLEASLLGHASQQNQKRLQKIIISNIGPATSAPHYSGETSHCFRLNLIQKNVNFLNFSSFCTVSFTIFLDPQARLQYVLQILSFLLVQPQ